MSRTRNGGNCKGATSLSSKIPPPKRGEVWIVNFDPTVGAEIRKTRPAIVLSSDAIGKLPLKLIAPVTDWKEAFAFNIWHVKVVTDGYNGLTKDSAVDVLQMRGVDIQRFIHKVEHLSSTLMEEINAAIAAVVEYE